MIDGWARSPFNFSAARGPWTSGRPDRRASWVPDDLPNRDSGQWPQTRFGYEIAQ